MQSGLLSASIAASAELTLALYILPSDPHTARLERPAIHSLNDPRFAPPTELPFLAGTSPFRQKGNAYLEDQKYLDAVVTGGFRACVSAIVEPSVRAFFEQRFIASEWYDAYPGALLESAAARVRGLAFETHRRQTGAWHAQRTARGIYGALLRLVSNENVALWGPRISSLYFEFGKTETRATGPREVLGSRRGIPRELAQWMMYASYGFCSAALKLAGARDATVVDFGVEPDGEAHGRELVRVPIRICWS